MLKKRLHLIPATLILSLLSCSAVEKQPVGDLQKNAPLPDYSIEAEENAEHIPTPLPEPPLTEGELWDTSFVDLSGIDPTRKLIAFTFDDAPTRNLEGICALFASFNEAHPDCRATATLFCNSILFDSDAPHLLAAACALGFELGNHTHSHARLTELSASRIEEEIEKTDRLLSKIDGRKTHLLRAPFGRVNDEVKRAAKTPIIDWTVDTLDWTGIDQAQIASTVMSNVYEGAIVLMHDGYENTLAALKALLPRLYEEGYQVLSVSQLIRAHGCHFRRGEVYIRARKGGCARSI